MSGNSEIVEVFCGLGVIINFVNENVVGRGIEDFIFFFDVSVVVYGVVSVEIVIYFEFGSFYLRSF